jgi:hypothetical protein
MVRIGKILRFIWNCIKYSNKVKYFFEIYFIRKNNNYMIYFIIFKNNLYLLMIYILI